MILPSFFLSGCAALLYEVLWVRELTLYGGHTTLAASAVLAAFMAGLALGSSAGGRAADRLDPRGLLRLYGGLELAIAASALLTKPLIGLCGSLLLRAGIVDLPPWAQSAVYFLAFFTLLLPPTVLMGATLPVLTRWRSVRRSADADVSLSLLYGLNTLGAVTGTALAGYILLPAIGVTRTMISAALLNAACCAMALGAARTEGASPKPKPPAGESIARILPLPAGLLALTGAAAMICEVAWTRAFAVLLGSTTYAFTTMLLTFLLGLAGGSLAFHRLRMGRRGREGRHPGASRPPSFTGLGVLLCAIGASVYAGLPFFDRLPYWLLRLHGWTALDPNFIHLIHFLLCSAVMIVPTLLMGAVLPWTVAAALPPNDSIGRHTGAYYAANTAGAIVGSAAAGLVLLPLLGPARSLLLAVWAYGTAALIAWSALYSRRARSKLPWNIPRYAAPAAVPVLLALAIVLCPRWNPRIQASGMAQYHIHYASVEDYGAFVRKLEKDTVLFHRDGANATVDVLRTPFGALFMRINGKTDASELGDLSSQLLMGYLPRVLHPGRPRRALMIGLGSGVTAAALAADPGIDRIEIVEIEPAVAEAARLFERANRGVLGDPRARLRLADGRQVLASPGPVYDLILSHPSNPWIAGIANLFTREAFVSARDRLADDGVFCQWFHGYLSSDEDVRMILRTFSTVFPHTLLLSNSGVDYFLIGAKTPLSWDRDRTKKVFDRLPPMRDDLRRLGRGLDDPLTLLAGSFVLDDSGVRAYGGEGRLHTDDRPRLEYSAADNFHSRRATHSTRDFAAEVPSTLPGRLLGTKLTGPERALLYDLLGRRILRRKLAGRAEEPIKKALSIDPRCARAWTHLGLIHEARGEDADALGAYRMAVKLDPELAEARTRLGAYYAGHNRVDEGLKELRRALELAPGDPWASAEAGLILLVKGDKAGAARLARTALAKSLPDIEPRLRLLHILEQAE